MFLKQIIFPEKGVQYPFSLDVLDQKVLTLSKPITILIGSNGSGKSTVLETIAASINSINISNQSIMDDDLFKEIRDYAKEVKLKFSTQTKRGFFFRASDFITYQHGIRTMKLQLHKELERVEEEYKDKSIFAQNQAKAPFAKSLAELEQQGRELTTLSHGESFLEFFKSRFTAPGIYVIDEPEIPLSYQNQYALLILMKEMVRKGAQFIFATHSPIIQAIDDSEIIDLDNDLKSVDFSNIDSVSFIKDFLNNKDRYIHYLNEED